MDTPDVPEYDFLQGIDLTDPESVPTMREALEGAEDTDVTDLRAVMIRRFAWDTMSCDRVAELLPKLGLALSSDEGMEYEHRESHQRMAKVYPFEGVLQDYAMILGTVLSTAMTEAYGVTEKVNSLRFAEQTAEVALHASRAIMAQMFFMGLVDYGPAVQITRVTIGPDGEVVVSAEDMPAAAPAEDGQLPVQTSFDDLDGTGV